GGGRREAGEHRDEHGGTEHHHEVLQPEGNSQQPVQPLSWGDDVTVAHPASGTVQGPQCHAPPPDASAVGSPSRPSDTATPSSGIGRNSIRHHTFASKTAASSPYWRQCDYSM